MLWNLEKKIGKPDGAHVHKKKGLSSPGASFFTIFWRIQNQAQLNIKQDLHHLSKKIWLGAMLMQEVFFETLLKAFESIWPLFIRDSKL